jgi:anti-sigma factor RsiW
MDCSAAQTMILDDARGALPAASRERLIEHMKGCAMCTHEAEVQRLLDEMLKEKLPRHAAPASLHERLADVSAVRPASKPVKSLWAALGGAAAAAAVLVGLWSGRAHFYRSADEAMLVREAVNDHLRLTYSEHPLEIESGGIHQVKPWFTGKVDFAPVVPFEGDDEFALLGGSVAYLIDRKAAAFSFRRRLHSISLFVFRPDELAWPSADLSDIDGVKIFATSMKGFNVLLFQHRGLGYALVSDVDGSELRALSARLTKKP